MFQLRKDFALHPFQLFFESKLIFSLCKSDTELCGKSRSRAQIARIYGVIEDKEGGFSTRKAFSLRHNRQKRRPRPHHIHDNVFPPSFSSPSFPKAFFRENVLISRPCHTRTLVAAKNVYNVPGAKTD